jgi:hypothetical protein
MTYKVFTNGSPLPASDLNTYLMNQSVIVFANATARGTTLTAPTEGMVTYLRSTDRLEVYNGTAWVDVNDNSGAVPLSTVTTAGDLIVGTGNATVGRIGIGTNGQVLSSNGTTATWVTPSSGGGMVQLATGFASGASFTLASINQSYKKLFMRLSNIQSSGSNFAVFFRNGTTNLSMVFGWRRFDGSSWSDGTGSSNPLSLTGFSNAGFGSGSFCLEIDNYASTTQRAINYWGAAQTHNNRTFFGSGALQDGSAMDNLLFNGNGGATVSFSYTLFGVN